MIEIGMSQVAKNYGFKQVLDQVNLEIKAGEHVAIVGRNGAGKTTLFKLMTGEERVDTGSVSIRKGRAVGYLEQIPEQLEENQRAEDVLSAAFANVTALSQRLRKLEAQMAEPLEPDALDKVMKTYARLQDEFIGLNGYEITEQFSYIVSVFGLKELLDRPFNLLSGGQKTRVKLAATLLKKPDVLLLDEPTNHLDIKTLEWLEGFLLKYQGTVVIISHDRYFLDKVTNKTIMLERGKCHMFNGNYSFSLQEQERLLLLEFEQYKTQQKKINAMKAAIKRYRQWGNEKDSDKMFRKAKVLERRLEKIEQLEKPQLEKAKIPIHFEGGRTGDDVLMVEGFSLALSGNTLFEEADFQVYVKEKVCLMGDNGTGKTSFLFALMGKLTGFTGEICVNPSVKMGYIPQEIRFENDKSKLIDAFRKEYSCTEGEARNILAKYSFFKDDVYKRVGSLSGGEKVLLKLAALIQNEVNFLILDEPTNHIDIETREMLEEALLNFKGTLLFISHDRYFINKIANKIVHIEHKQFHSFYGDYEDFKKREK
ncbi:MAG: ATP-binding cassette domain-containing protein [Turicibacter sp.]|nr:ATP-binding cassette domain-containing protein [Turicibacter sp.]